MRNVIIEMQRRNGLRGSRYINDASTYGDTLGTWNFWRLEFLRAGNIKAIDVDDMDNSSDITSGTTFPAGTVIQGKIREFSFAGTPAVIAYYGDSAGRAAPFA